MRKKIEGEIKPTDKKALLKETGKPKVYVDAKTGKVSNRPTADSVGIDRTTWHLYNKERLARLFAVTWIIGSQTRK